MKNVLVVLPCVLACETYCTCAHMAVLCCVFGGFAYSCAARMMCWKMSRRTRVAQRLFGAEVTSTAPHRRCAVLFLGWGGGSCNGVFSLIQATFLFLLFISFCTFTYILSTFLLFSSLLFSSLLFSSLLFSYGLRSLCNLPTSMLERSCRACTRRH